MKKQISCPVCDSPASRLDIPERAVFEIDCPKCTRYQVDHLYWGEFTSDPEIKKIASALSTSLSNYFKAKRKPFVLGSGGDVLNIQRWLNRGFPPPSGSPRQPRRRRNLKYNPSRGGHAPGHLRDAFGACWDVLSAEHWYDALAEEDALLFYEPKMQRKWEAMALTERARWLIGQLWNCSDIMPSDLCSTLEMPEGSTYAQAVRKLRADLE
ncbi:MAG: hypothetical protein AAB403_19695 [Planctomycetota bacterium]